MSNGEADSLSPRTGQYGDLATIRSKMTHVMEENQLLLSTVKPLSAADACRHHNGLPSATLELPLRCCMH